MTTEPDAGRDAEEYKPAQGFRPARPTGEGAARRGADSQAEAPAFAGATNWWRWRHTRPFWGGLFVIFGGSLTILTERAALPLIIHIGIQGIAGYLLPIIIMLCGFLLWFNAQQRTFYAILAILLALGTFITSNLGGFFIGMLLSLVGGSLAFAWEPLQRAPTPRPVKSPPPQLPASRLTLILRNSEADADADSPGETTLPMKSELDRPGRDENTSSTASSGSS